MKGLSSAAKEQIASVVERMFDSMAVNLVGNLPKFQNKKTLIIGSSNRYNLANLFVQSISNKQPNTIERDLLKGLLDSASGYIDALKNKTQSTIVEKLDGMAREASLKKQKITESEIMAVIDEEMSKAKSHFIKITEAEGTKIRNTGKAVNIARAAADVGQEDPYVFFQVIKDASTCKWCIQNHLMPDGVTPRIFKLSEVKQTYLSHADRKNGEISLCGQHPHCRCSVSYLPKSFGFKNGKIAYVSQDHDEYENQNKD